MQAVKDVPFEDIRLRGSIRQADVARFKAEINGNGGLTAETAALLVALNASCPVQDASWPDFYSDAITAFVVHQASPSGYVTRGNADWLMSAMAFDGRIARRSDLDLLITILEEARWAPPSLVAFCLAQVHRAVLTGDGPLRAMGDTAPGMITDADVELVRRIIYAGGGDDAIAVTRAEAEVLFAINDILTDEPTNEAWTELFVKAIANLMMSVSGYRVPTREEALSSEAWLEERGTLSPLEIVETITRIGLTGVLPAYIHQSREERAIAQLERHRIALVTDEEMAGEDDAQWLAERFGTKGKLTANESALLAFLASEGVEMDARLATTVAGLRSAA
ncbi:MAG: hypothetical protein NW217_08090 [Hyphomicrobiaceae bacterium]|nr:hypothetical protein [Hyphomicrobiaceae bacterium]